MPLADSRTCRCSPSPGPAAAGVRCRAGRVEAEWKGSDICCLLEAGLFPPKMLGGMEYELVRNLPSLGGGYSPLEIPGCGDFFYVSSPDVVILFMFKNRPVKIVR